MLLNEDLCFNFRPPPPSLEPASASYALFVVVSQAERVQQFEHALPHIADDLRKISPPRELRQQHLRRQQQQDEATIQQVRSGAQFNWNKIITKIIMKIITKVQFDFFVVTF